MNAIAESYEILNREKDGLLGEMWSGVLHRGGIVHAEPECFYMAEVHRDHPERLVVWWACGDPLLLWTHIEIFAGKYKTISWQRAFKGRESWTTYSLETLLKHKPKKEHE